MMRPLFANALPIRFPKKHKKSDTIPKTVPPMTKKSRQSPRREVVHSLPTEPKYVQFRMPVPCGTVK